MTIEQKAHFLQDSFLPLLASIPAHIGPRWGKMNLQQMIEHFTDAVKVASARKPAPRLLTPPENLGRMRDFVFSEKLFRENTVNPLMPETPAPVQLPGIDAAIDELQKEIDHFFSVFSANPELETLNPFFGSLDYAGNVHLLYKHAWHHLRQFGIEGPQEGRDSGHQQ